MADFLSKAASNISKTDILNVPVGTLHVAYSIGFFFSHSNTLHKNIIPTSGLLLWWHKTYFYYCDFEFMLHANIFFLNIWPWWNFNRSLFYILYRYQTIPHPTVNLKALLVVRQKSSCRLSLQPSYCCFFTQEFSAYCYPFFVWLLTYVWPLVIIGLD